MITYELSLERQNILGADKFSIAADSNESVSLRFHFDRSWRIFESKAAVFKSSCGKYYVLDIHLNCVTVPWEVLRNTGSFELAVIAYENEVVLTSKKVSIAVSGSLLPEFCRQLSPTETIFDRFKTEARNRAFADYNSEIQALNHTHNNKVLELNAQIAAEQANTEAVRMQKDAEIAQLNYEASVAENSHNAEVAALQAQIALNAEKSHKWDLIDTALRKKTEFTQPLWQGGTEPYELPMIYLDSVNTLNSNKISNSVTSIGLSMPKITNLNSFFSSHTNLTDFRMLDTDTVTTMNSICEYCYSLKNAYFEDLSSCLNVNNSFANCRAAEHITLNNLNSVRQMSYCFSNCYALKEITGTVNANDCTTFEAAFSNCANLETIRFVESSIKINIDFGSCVSLSKESLFSIANGLFGGTTGTVSFSRHAVNTNLTSDERTALTNLVRNEKGWTLSLS